MEEYLVRIISVEYATHDMLRIVTERPAGYEFTPGQATEISINKPGWNDERRPFTFTSLPWQDYLEFNIKTYPERNSVTNELLHLKQNDEIILHDVFGAITYQGPGVFIAGGAGVTPFISIFRYLYEKNEVKGNTLILANKTAKDIILENEFRKILGDKFINILSREKTEKYYYGLINEDFLKSHISDFHQHFYVCGPPPFMDSILADLKRLGVAENAVVVEI